MTREVKRYLDQRQWTVGLSSTSIEMKFWKKIKNFVPTWEILRSEVLWACGFGLGQHVLLKHLVWLAQLSKTMTSPPNLHHMVSFNDVNRLCRNYTKYGT